MKTWFECWQNGEASVVYGQPGPDSQETVEGHNYKAWYDEASPAAIRRLASWVEAHFPVVLIYGNWHRTEDGRLMCDCCYENPVKTHSTICGGSALCRECSERLSQAYWNYRHREQARKAPHTLLPQVRARLRQEGFEF